MDYSALFTRQKRAEAAPNHALQSIRGLMSYGNIQLETPKMRGAKSCVNMQF